MNVRAGPVAELTPELGNLAAAWRWAIERRDAVTTHRMMVGIYFTGETGGWLGPATQLLASAVRVVREQVLSGDPRQRQDSALLFAWLQFGQGGLLGLLGLADQARACAEESLAFLSPLEHTEKWEEYYTLSKRLLAEALLWQGDFAGSARLCEELLIYWQTTRVSYWPYPATNDTFFWQSQMYSVLATNAWYLGDYAQAPRLEEQALTLRERIGVQKYTAYSLRSLARILCTKGDYRRAEEVAEEALQIGQSLGDRISVAWTHAALGQILAALGRSTQARHHFQQSLKIAQETGCHVALTESLNGLGALELRLGRVAEARRLYGESLASFDQPGMAPANFLASALIGLGHVAYHLRDLGQARQHFQEALRTPGRAAWETMNAIAGMAQVIAAEGDTTRAVELLAFVAQHPFTSHATRQRATQLLRELEAELPADVFAATVGRRRSRELDEVVAELIGGPTDFPSAETTRI
jgi:tetratricopeptide (TPR) repeat protein